MQSTAMFARAATAAISGRWPKLAAAETLTSLQVENYRVSLDQPQGTFNKPWPISAHRIDSASLHATSSRALPADRSGISFSRELSKHVGPNKRFAAVGEHVTSLRLWTSIAEKLRQSSRSFQADGMARRFQEKDISLDNARRFAHVAFKKLRAELRKRRGADA